MMKSPLYFCLQRAQRAAGRQSQHGLLQDSSSAAISRQVTYVSSLDSVSTTAAKNMQAKGGDVEGTANSECCRHCKTSDGHYVSCVRAATTGAHARCAERSATNVQRCDANVRSGHCADGEITDPQLTLQMVITGMRECIELSWLMTF